MDHNAPMHKQTEKELEQIGIAEGVTLTAEMTEKLRNMLTQRDSKVAEFAENVLYRTEHLIEIARMLMRPEDELPLVERIKPDIEALQSRAARLQEEATRNLNLDAHIAKAAKEAGVDLQKIFDAALERMEKKLPL